MSDDTMSGYQGRGMAGDRDDTSMTRSQGGHDTDGRSADYDGRMDPTEDRMSTAERMGATTRDALGDNTDGMGRDRSAAITAEETGSLISADKVMGTTVYNRAGDRLGTIDGIMLNKRSGRVAYAVMSFGGFLGIGERYHPLPWDALTYDEDKGGYNIDQDAAKLKDAPNYSRDEVDHLNYGERGGEIRDYYGVGDRSRDSGAMTSGQGGLTSGSSSSTMPSSGIGSAGDRTY